MKLTGQKTGNTANANRISCPEGEFWVPQSVCSDIRYNSNTGALTLTVDDWWWEKRIAETDRPNFTIDL